MDSTYFQFNNKYYVQIFGTPMGSPISGLFADILMEDLESDCLKKLYFSPMFYFRNVDDILTFIPFDKIDEILTIFNSYDVRLQFTHEIESENRINFLELLIIRLLIIYSIYYPNIYIYIWRED